MERINRKFNTIKKSSSLSCYIFFICIILNISIISSANNRYVFFPLKRKDNSKIKNTKNITEIMEFIYLEPLISELTLGTPEQKSNIIFRTDCTYMYITSYSHNTKKTRTSDFIQLKYGNYMFYDEDKSKSVKYYDKIFNHSQYPYDNQFLTNCISENMKINDKNINIDLMLSKDIEYEEPGAFCLQLEEGSSVLHFTSSFPILLKQNYSLIDNYRWFIYYGQNNKEKDYIVIGANADEFINPETGRKLYPNLDIENDYINDNDELDIQRAAMKIKFGDIYLISDTNKNKEKFEDTKNLVGKLMPNIGFIVGTTNYSQYIEKNIFKIYLDLGKCHKSIFSQRPNLVGQEYIYYYCEESLFNNIKNVFKNIVFKHLTFSENFILTFDDLFIRQNGYLIFLVIFSTHQHFYWDLGTPFLKKYQFDYDFENKLVGYYHITKKDESGNNNTNGNNNNILNYILIIFFLALIFFGILIVLGIYVTKTCFKNRKKRANELLDEDYEYQGKTEGNNKNETINE